MFYFSLINLFLFFLLINCTSTSSNSNSSIELLGAQDTACSALSNDLKGIHEVLTHDFSGYYYDPSFKVYESKVFNDLSKSTSECKSIVDYAKSVRSYLATFRDPHLKTSEINGISYLSTGIILRKINEQWYVRDIDESFIKDKVIFLGDELVSCDGKSPQQIMTQEILPYVSYSSLESILNSDASQIFIRWDKSEKNISICKFHHYGRELTAQLEWKKTSANWVDSFFPRMPIYKKIDKPYGHWLKLSTMMSSSKEDVDQLKMFVDDAFKFSRDRYLVMDLRGNSGGSSSWGQQWIQNLTGQKWQSIEDSKPGLVLASKGNYEHFYHSYEESKNNGGLSKEREQDKQRFLECMKSHEGQLVPCDVTKPEQLEKYLKCMKENNNSVQICHVSNSEQTSKQKKNHSEKNKFKGKLIVLTDSVCFSSCELFVNMLRERADAIHVGLPTNASTHYGDTRVIETPSKITRYYLPTKVLIYDKNRKSGEPIAPDILLRYDSKMELMGKDSLELATEMLIQQRKI